ncbi:hypothetical protein [Pseudomonas fluorescens]|uniref:Uncharacterized protein n=1 Tax=Pseudomonas fluorescens (strain Pf0-1) TaxID=205922 RepID=Q3K455_PSEPF|nr:hypothetical protein [Pseudomonas fluorescens]ABA77449.1 hypothetical protein Pfl01_5715 [Pseudomonas fluorescens Pf0-1]
MTSTDKHSVAAVIGLLVLSIAMRPAIVSIGSSPLLIQDQFALSFTQAALLARTLTRHFGTDRCVIAALSPVCFSALRDHTGNFDLAYALLFDVLVFMLCLTPPLKPALADAPEPVLSRAR